MYGTTVRPLNARGFRWRLEFFRQILAPAPRVHSNAQLGLTKRSFIKRAPRQRGLPPNTLTRIRHSKLRSQPNNRRLSTLPRRHRITSIQNALSPTTLRANRRTIEHRLTHRPQQPATKKLNSMPERSFLCATGSSKTTGSEEAGEAGNSTKTEDFARSADDRTAGKSSTTNRLLTFRMLAYGPTGGNLGRSRATHCHLVLLLPALIAARAALSSLHPPAPQGPAR
jgi:hypothetical protein